MNRYTKRSFPERRVNIFFKEKWNAWNSLGNMCQDRAMQEYIGKLTEIDPEWTDKNVPENR